MIFENIDRDFVIALQRLPRVGTKRLHTTLHIDAPGDGIRFEVEPSLRQDAEKHPVVIQPNEPNMRRQSTSPRRWS